MTMPPDPFAPANRTKEVVTNLITAAVFLVVVAAVLIPVVWVLVHGYRWALA